MFIQSNYGLVKYEDGAYFFEGLIVEGIKYAGYVTFNMIGPISAHLEVVENVDIPQRKINKALELVREEMVRLWSLKN